MIAVNVNTLNITLKNIIDPIKSASKSYVMASTNEFMAVDIPASNIATLKAMPFIFKVISNTSIIKGDIISFKNATTIESDRFLPMFSKSRLKPIHNIIKGIVDCPK